MDYISKTLFNIIIGNDKKISMEKCIYYAYLQLHLYSTQPFF